MKKNKNIEIKSIKKDRKKEKYMETKNILSNIY